MKKLLVFAAILALGASVYAYGPGYGMGYKMGNGMGYQGNFGPGNCPGYGGFGMGPRGMKGFKGPRGQFAAEAKSFTKEEATQEITKYVEENFKGYKIQEVKSFDMPRGTIYFADVVNASGNKFQFRLNPFGQVVGPFKTNN
jgi:hypothetical protein